MMVIVIMKGRMMIVMIIMRIIVKVLSVFFSEPFHTMNYLLILKQRGLSAPLPICGVSTPTIACIGG